MSSLLTLQHSLSSNATCTSGTLDYVLDSNTDEITALHVAELKQLTSTVSFQKHVPNEDDASPSICGPSDSIITEMSPADVKQHTESPRGISDWAAIFGEDESNASLPIGQCGGSSQDLIDEKFDRDSLLLPQSCANIFGNIQTLNVMDAEEFSNPTSTLSKRNEGVLGTISKSRSAARREKCNRARLGTYIRGLKGSEPSSPKSPVYCPGTESSFPTTIEEVETSRSRERKIRNRASVQRCRAKKSLYYDNLEIERKMLRTENARIREVVKQMEQSPLIRRMLQNYQSVEKLGLDVRMTHT